MRTIPVKGFESWYCITDNGTATSTRFGIPLKTTLAEGYPKANLYKGGRPKTMLIHRLVAEHFIPNPNNLPIVNHKDGDRENCNFTNLEWVTASENVRDGFARGRVHPQQGKRYVDRRKECEMCKHAFEYVKPKQRFCGKRCAGMNNLFGKNNLALHEAGELGERR